MVSEAPLEETGTGVVQAGPGRFVVNAREVRWLSAEGRGSVTPFGDDAELPQVGVNLFVLGPGDPIGMCHWEADQEDFLILSGEALLIIEGRRRTTRSRCTPASPDASRPATARAGCPKLPLVLVHRAAPSIEARLSYRKSQAAVETRREYVAWTDEICA